MGGSQGLATFVVVRDDLLVMIYHRLPGSRRKSLDSFRQHRTLLHMVPAGHWECREVLLKTHPCPLSERIDWDDRPYRAHAARCSEQTWMETGAVGQGRGAEEAGSRGSGQPGGHVPMTPGIHVLCVVCGPVAPWLRDPEQQPGLPRAAP